MLAGQTGYGANGIQNALFPLEDMFVTQGPWEYTYSHDHTYAMDFQGWSNGQRVYQCPVYAPFDCHCVYHYGSSAPAIVWTSDNPVNFIDGTIDYCTIQFTHENDSINRHPIGQTKRQGDIISHTGTMGTTGDHVHIEAKKGTYSGFTNVGSGGTSGLTAYRLTGSSPLWDLLGVNDTIITRSYYDNHNGQRITYYWNSYAVNNPQPGPHPIVTGQSKFPWFIYFRKFRNGNR